MGERGVQMNCRLYGFWLAEQLAEGLRCLDEWPSVAIGGWVQSRAGH